MNEKKPRYSLVTPVYNTEKYISTAIDSVRGQTFADWELILVDDASTDGSGAICDAACQADARIRCIHLQQNGGASRARNAGMDCAQGEFLLFLDADDEMERDLLARLEASPRADLTVWGVWDEYLDEQERCFRRAAHRPPAGFYRGASAVRRVLIDLEADTLLGYIWNKCYRLELLRQSGVRFEDRLVTEDVFFNLRQCEGWESLCALDTAALHYRHRSAHTSITGRFVPDYFEQNRERVQELLALYDRWGCADAHVLAVLGGIYARYLFAAIERLYDPRSGVAAAGRRAFLRARFDAGQDALFARVIPHASPAGALSRAMAAALKTRNAALCLLIGRSVRFARVKLPGLFTRLRQSR
jgi:glycosyltransferase involved in cell wall biosynthesis